MSSLIVPVTIIEKIAPHPNADALELAQVLGWRLVVRKGEHAVGGMIVYFPIDTVLPDEAIRLIQGDTRTSRDMIKRLNGDAARLLLVLLTCDGTEWKVDTSL